jgi:hypothetical protein
MSSIAFSLDGAGDDGLEVLAGVAVPAGVEDGAVDDALEGVELPSPAPLEMADSLIGISDISASNFPFASCSVVCQLSGHSYTHTVCVLISS